MNDSTIKPVPYGITKAQIKRQRAFDKARSNQSKTGFFAHMRRYFAS